MNNREIEERVQKAYSDIAPDIQEQVLAYCKEQKGQILTMNYKKKNRIYKRIAAIAAVFVLVLGLGYGTALYSAGRKVEAVISLDVNPSIEIDVNNKEKVLEVRGLNEDGLTVIGDMDFKGSSLDVAVNALIGSMLRNGYLSEAANSILISVDDEDEEAGRSLQHRLLEEVNQILEGSALSGAVLSQTVKEDGELSALAEQNGITLGKAQLIRQILKQNSLYTFEQLAPLTINQLNLIAGSQEMELDDVENTGIASDKNYIGEEAAKQIALDHAKVAGTDAERLHASMDLEDGRMVYEVEFVSGGLEYEYEIDASDGTLLDFESERDDEDDWDDDFRGSDDDDRDDGFRGSDDDDRDDDFRGSDDDDEDIRVPEEGEDPAEQQEELIGKSRAGEAALKHAGVSEAEAKRMEVELDREKGKPVYEVEFKCNGYEYEYEIDALTGEVLDADREVDD